MKKKATSSSSDGISFQSLPEAKAFVDHFFDELLDLYTSGYKASQIYAGFLLPSDISEKEKDDRLKARKKLQDKASDDLHSLGQHLIKMCASVSLLDPFGESREFFELIVDQVDLWLNQQPARLGYWDLRTLAESERKRIIQGLPGYLAYLQTKATTKPKRGRRSKADLKNRNNRELLVAILLKHHRYGSKDDLKTDPISTKEACKLLGKTEPTLSRTWKEIKPDLTYASYVKLCGRFDTLRKFLKAIDSKEGYLEKSNKEGAIDNAED